MTHYVYIAASSDLLDRSNELHGRSAIKVGTSCNPRQREVFLSGLDPRDGRHVPACGGHDDWKVVAEKYVGSEEDALDLEHWFKDAFDPMDMGRLGAGEGDIVLLPGSALVGEPLARLDPDVREMYFAARSRMYAAIRAAGERPQRYVDDEEQYERRTTEEFERDEDDGRGENLDRAARNHEDGSYYED